MLVYAGAGQLLSRAQRVVSQSQGRMLLSHNFNVAAEEVQPLSRDAFAQVFVTAFKTQGTCRCRPLNHPHWMVEILFPMTEWSPQQVGERCAQAMIDYRQPQQSRPTTPMTVLVLGGIKTTPPTSASPEALQPGDWGVDVVETSSAQTFLQTIAWETTIAAKPVENIFKVERSI